MGKVVAFPLKSKRKNLKKKGPWRMADLRHKRPRGHKLAKRGPRGKALIAVGQVWIEGHTQRLWVVKELYQVRKTFYPNDVVFQAYRGREGRRVAETTFRLSMQIWEDWIISHNATMEKFNRLSETDPQSPFRGKGGRIRAQSFFGLDAQGYRVD